MKIKYTFLLNDRIATVGILRLLETNSSDECDVMVGNTWRKVIIYSEFENKENGDWLFNVFNHSIKQETNQRHKCRKIIAMKRDFSPDFTLMILKGELKDGDKIILQCLTKYVEPEGIHCNRGSDVTQLLYTNGGYVVPIIDKSIEAKNESTKQFIGKTGDKIFCEIEVTGDPDEVVKKLMKSLREDTELLEGVKVHQILFKGKSIEGVIKNHLKVALDAYETAINNINEQLK